MMFKTILAATDDSAHAAKALDLASDLAQKYGAQLIILHVVNPDQLSDDVLHMAEVEHLLDTETAAETEPPSPTPDMKTLRANAALRRRLLTVLGERVVERAQRHVHKQGLARVKTLVEEGDPAQQILRCAERERADLIVLGSRGLSDLQGLLMGSVSHKVGQLATCSCISVK
jgi:nucleotide-binding universal stress UspA family protein